MRYKLKPKKARPKLGDTRSKRLFALFPICLNREIRWLEWVTVIEFYGLCGWGYSHFEEERQ